jgi:hypothetical protein
VDGWEWKGLVWEEREPWNFWNLALMIQRLKVGDVPRGIEDSAEDFRLETLDALDVGRLG